MAAVGRIAVGVDGSGGGLHALAWTAALAVELQAEVLVVLVYDPMDELFQTRERRDFPELRAAAEERVAGEWSEPLRNAQVTHRALVVEGKPAAEVLVQTAVDEGVDLLVIGNVGLTGWRERIVGSVASRVLQLAPCPVTVVPQPRPAS